MQKSGDTPNFSVTLIFPECHQDIMDNKSNLSSLQCLSEEHDEQLCS